MATTEPSARLLAFALVVFLLVRGSGGGPYQRHLLKELLKDYIPLERPVEEDDQAITVHFTLSLMQIIDLDEKNQVLTINAWLQMYWYDHYLRWNESDYPGVKMLHFSAGQVWKPDILLYNSANEDFGSTFHTDVLVNSSGYCQWLPPGILKSTCQIDVRWFPFDTQKCLLKFGSWTHDGWLLDLQMMDIDMSGYVTNGEWDLVGITGRENKVFYECCQEPYLDITFIVVMRRRTLYYALHLLVPCLLLSTMTLFVFLMPADSREKISLGITILLSLTVFLLLLVEVLPATSDSVPLIGQYLATSLGMVGLSVVTTVFVLQYHHRDPEAKGMPRWVRLVVLDWGAWLLRMHLPGEGPAGQPHSAPRLLSCSSDNDEGKHSPARPAFPTANGHLATAGATATTAATSVKPPKVPRPFLLSPEPLPSVLKDLLAAPVPSSLLNSLLKELHYVAQHVQSQDAARATGSQWKFAAAVIDRLCLLLFALVHLVCSMSLLLAAPNFAVAITK